MFSQYYKLVAGYGRREGWCSSLSEWTFRPCSALQEHPNTKGLLRLSSSLIIVTGQDNTLPPYMRAVNYTIWSKACCLIQRFQRGAQRCSDGMDSSLPFIPASRMISEPIFLAQIMPQIVSNYHIKKSKVILPYFL